MENNKKCDSSVPEDLVFEILSFLPIKSLLRLKSVSKSWYALLVSPNFASNHIRNSDNNPDSDHRRLIIGFHAVPNETGEFRILSYKSLDVVADDFQLRRYHYSGSAFLSKTKEYWFRVYQRLLGSYNGLVCLADENLREFAIWNPATGQTKLVRQSNKIGAQYERTEHAFGYDFKTNAYKVMRITPITDEAPYKYETEMYTCNDDSWRNCDAAIPDGICLADCEDRPTVCVKGVYSTVAYTRAKESEKLAYFLLTIDMSNEVFVLTPMPEGLDFKTSTWRDKVVTELQESVACIAYDGTATKEDVDSYVVFILNDYGPNGIWTKLYDVSIPCQLFPNRSILPIGFWKNDYIVIANTSGSLGEMFLFNHRTCEAKDLRVRGVYMKFWNTKKARSGSMVIVLEYEEDAYFFAILLLPTRFELFEVYG